MLSPSLLDLLREYWRESRPGGWLFRGKLKITSLSPRQLNRAFTSAKHMAGLVSQRTCIYYDTAILQRVLEARVRDQLTALADFKVSLG